MKYLKRFNEELKPQTYRSAARKLDKMGHSDRAQELKDWANKREDDDNLIKWERALQEYSQYGKFRIKTTNPEDNKTCEGDFYLDIIFDEMGFIESTDDEGAGIWFHIGAIPVDEETKERFDNCLPDPDMGNGFYWMLSCGINYKKTDNETIEFTKFYIDHYDEYVGGEARFADRGSAGRFKNLLIKMFTDETLDYPSGYTDADNIYQVFERSILAESGFSSDYGLTLEDIADYIRSISPNMMYKP